MEFITFFVGSYTQNLTPEIMGFGDGISTVQLNNETGELKILHITSTVNPSYLTLSDDNIFLYCNTEVAKEDVPKVQAYKINKDFSLEFLNERPIAGGYPCHIENFNKSILVSCYETGNIIQFPIDAFGKVMPSAKNHQHYGSSINKNRQEGPHAHQIAVNPVNKQLYACDLGIDIIKAYFFDEAEFVADGKNDIPVTKGGGPRHLVFNNSGTLAYVINELSGNISILKKIDDKFVQISELSSLPLSYTNVPSASAIRIHPNQQFLYAANRTLDAITIFRIHGEALEVIDYHYTKGKEIREFNITPNGKWLIACHQNSHDTIVYLIKPDGKLTENYRTTEIKTPVCIKFLNNN